MGSAHGPKTATSCGCGMRAWTTRLVERPTARDDALVARDESPAERVVADELARGLAQLLGREVERSPTAATDGAVVVGTPARSSVVRGLGWEAQLALPVRKATDPVDAIGGRNVDRDRVGWRCRAAVRRVSLPATAANGPTDRVARHRRAPATGAPSAESLGQPRRQHRARLRRALAVELERAARSRGPARGGLRARQRVARDQRHRRQQRQRQPEVARAPTT